VSGLPDGFVLAGGASSRMGSDKATLAWRGAPLGLRLAELLGTACGRVSIVRRELADPAWSLADGRRVASIGAEGGGHRHPLWGIAAALREARSPWAVLCATDLVGLTRADVGAVAAAPDQVATWHGQWALLLSLSVGRLGEVEALAAEGAPVAALVAGLRAVPLLGPVVDANTRPDLDEA
jgi:molybdopterin-guanine dinucleotide biosynthesis protein A